jgi:hypothetical protein
MPAKAPDFATLASEALEAADQLIAHIDGCQWCADESSETCHKAKLVVGDYRTKRDKALKAMRRKK